MLHTAKTIYPLTLQAEEMVDTFALKKDGRISDDVLLKMFLHNKDLYLSDQAEPFQTEKPSSFIVAQNNKPLYIFRVFCEKNETIIDLKPTEHSDENYTVLSETLSEFNANQAIAQKPIVVWPPRQRLKNVFLFQKTMLETGFTYGLDPNTSQAVFTRKL